MSDKQMCVVACTTYIYDVCSIVIVMSSDKQMCVVACTTYIYMMCVV